MTVPSSPDGTCDVHTLYAERDIALEGLLVDVRERIEFNVGHVAGARHIPLGDVVRRAPELDRTRPVYVMCFTGARSLKAQERLVAQGFSDVRNVVGGFQAWVAAGYPVEKTRFC